jgi:hypothetical protein
MAVQHAILQLVSTKSIAILFVDDCSGMLRSHGINSAYLRRLPSMSQCVHESLSISQTRPYKVGTICLHFRPPHS